MAGAERTEEAVIRIDGIAAGGAGVGRLPSGVAVFVHRTAPAEMARVRVTEQRRRWARADLVELVEASPARRVAPCPHYDRCGGCTLEHLRYDAQLRAKGEIVRQALRRIGGAEVALPEVVAAPAEFRYRNRVSFALHRLVDGRVVAGFHALGRPDRILDIGADCLLPEGPLAEAWRALRAAWGPGAARLPDGARLRLTLRSSAAGEVGLLIEGGVGRGDAGALMRDVPGLVGVWHLLEGHEIVTLAGADSIAERWRDFDLRLGPGAFLQVNRGTARLLEDHVLERVGDPAGRYFVDAYCGVGFHAHRLAAAGARAVVGIELDAAAVQQARELTTSRGVDSATFIAGDVGAELPAVLPADVVIVNPPRVGLAPEVCDALRAQPPRRLLYVSCDPATLARDLARLAPALRLERVHCFDLFPQTSHVETVAELGA